MSKAATPEPADRQAEGRPGGDAAGEPPLLDHCYDGIQEYDNPTPAWMTWLFIVTVIWSVAYVVLLEVGVIRTVHEELADDMAALREVQAAAAAKAPEVDEAGLAALIHDAGVMEVGRQVYGLRCGVCHGADGTGGIGPNLTDDAWEYGGGLLEIYDVVRNGTTKGMPPWGSILSSDELAAVTAFTRSLSDLPDTAGDAGGEAR